MAVCVVVAMCLRQLPQFANTLHTHTQHTDNWRLEWGGVWCLYAGAQAFQAVGYEVRIQNQLAHSKWRIQNGDSLLPQLRAANLQVAHSVDGAVVGPASPSTLCNAADWQSSNQIAAAAATSTHG